MKEKTVENNFYIDGSLAIDERHTYEKEIKKLGIYKYIKRMIDIVLSVIGLIVLSPFFIIIALIIKLDSKGPVIYKHKRIGKNGQEIYLYKFRTMYQDADIKLQELLKNENIKKEWEENYKLKNDPRITRVGKILRKTSIDELPQIINIIKGELAIIGPRPVVKDELEKYGDNKKKFLSITPGLTGYWASNGRSDIDYDERMQMELYYIDNITFKLDIKIFCKTIFSVIKRKGAI